MKILYHEPGDIVFTVSRTGISQAYLVDGEGVMVEMPLEEALVMARDN